MKKKPFIIYQGGQAVMQVNILNQETRAPYDLTSVESISTCFTNDDGSELMVDLSSGITVQGNPVLGQILITLSAVKTGLLIPVQLATLELKIKFPSVDPIKTQIINAYNVVASVC